MASVFLSYDHEDYARAAPIAAVLEAHGHMVWWDRQIHGGAEYNSEIELAVARSDAVIVLWSEKSVRSAWVRDEAAEGRDAGKLVPVLIGAVKPPMGFRQYQTIDLAAWNGSKRIPRLPDLLHAIDEVGKGRPSAAFAMEPPSAAPPSSVAPGPDGIPRRLLIGSGAAVAAVALAGGGVWWSTRPRVDPRVQTLIDKAEDAVRHGTADERTVHMLEQATSIESDNAKPWGWLALVNSLIAQHADPKDTERLVDQAQRAAQRALSINAKEPHALLAMFELEGSTLDWFTRDQRLRQIITIDPKNVGAIAELVLLTQAVGFSRESWQWNERALALEPLSADYLGKRALKLWILGRTSEADKVVDQVRALYPNDPWVWFVRLHIYAFTGRIAAAQAMLADAPAGSVQPKLAGIWRTALAAMAHPTSESIAKAREACIDGTQISPNFADEAIAIMCALRDVNTAFDLADAFLFSRGPLAARQSGNANAAQQAAWRVSTQWMFTPAAAVLRVDRRFLPLCDGVGLTEYWRKRGIKPDYQRA